MNLDVNNCTTVLVRISLSALGEAGEFHRLSAKFGDDVFTVWIKPSKPFPPNAEAQISALQSQGSQLLFRGTRVDSVGMKMALNLFLAALKTLKKPALLVAHSEKGRLLLLLRQIEKTGMVDMFQNIIVGCTDSYPIFQKKNPSLEKRNQLMLPNLLQHFLQKEYTEDVNDESYYLEVLENLVTRFIPKLELIANSYQRLIPSLMKSSTSTEIFKGLKPFLTFLSPNILVNLTKAGISYPMLERASRTGNVTKILNLFEKRSYDEKRKNAQYETALTILRFFENQAPSHNRNERLKVRPGKLEDRIDLTTPEPGEEENSMGPVTMEPNEFPDFTDLLMAAEQTPYRKDYSSTGQPVQPSKGFVNPRISPEEFRNGVDSMTTDQKQSSDVTGSLMAADERRSNNDRTVTRNEYTMFDEINALMEAKNSSHQPPSTQMPAYQPRGTQKPAYQSPGTQMPAYQSRGTQRPAYQSPGTQMPAYQSPDIQMPAYQQPPGTQMPGYQSPGTQRPAYQSPGTQMSSYQPRGTQRPAYQSPGTQMPAYQPRGTQRPAYQQPPGTQMPAYQSPGNQSPDYQPPDTRKPVDDQQYQDWAKMISWGIDLSD